MIRSEGVVLLLLVAVTVLAVAAIFGIEVHHLVALIAERLQVALQK